VNTGATILVVYDIISPVVLVRRHQQAVGNKFHLAIIASGWIELSKNIRNWLEFEGGDGEKTLGQAEHSCIIWRKRYIINPNLAEKGTVASSSTSS
jgi:hypothetical protein